MEDEPAVVAVCGGHDQVRPRFPCPLCSNKNWASVPQLLGHIEKFHLVSDQSPPADFLRSYNRRICSSCQILAVGVSPCRRCKATPDSKATAADIQEGHQGGTAHVWEDSSFLPRGTLRYVPTGVVQAWASAFADEIEHFLAEPSAPRPSDPADAETHPRTLCSRWAPSQSPVQPSRGKSH